MEISDTNYITLQEAARYCNYTQEYLSLRARQGKLKSVKLGRNWYTTESWLKNYIDSQIFHRAPTKQKVETEVRNLWDAVLLRPQTAIVTVAVVSFLVGGYALGFDNGTAHKIVSAVEGARKEFSLL